MSISSFHAQKAEFVDHARSYGLDVDFNAIENGKLLRCKHEHDPKQGAKKSGWVKYYENPDGSSVAKFGYFHGDQNHKFEWKCRDNVQKQTEAERDAYFAEQRRLEAERKIKADEETRQKQAEAAVRANRTWDTAHTDPNHPYLKAKGIQPHNSRVDPKTGELLIPMSSAPNTLASVQRIRLAEKGEEDYTPERDTFVKKFQYEGQVLDTYCMMGNRENKDRFIILCEGFATAASISEARPDGMVMAAMTANNMVIMAQRLKETLPEEYTIMVAADNDVYPKKDGRIINVGLNTGEHIKECGDIEYALPTFENVDTSTKPKDFNDLHQLCGIEEVRKQLNAVLQPLLDSKHALRVESENILLRNELDSKANAEFQPQAAQDIPANTSTRRQQG